jgi:hypothetical protein
MEKILAQLFESAPKVKLLKLFFRNSESTFSIEEIQKHARLQKRQIMRELKTLLKLKMVEKKTRLHVIENEKTLKTPHKIAVFGVNPLFELYNELKLLLMKLPTESDKKLTEDIKRLGKVKLAIVSGFFLNNPLARVDLLIVGDGLNRAKLSNFLSRLEHTTGRTIGYSIMNSEEFQYRMNMFDRFLRDILEFPHQKLINRMNIA